MKKLVIVPVLATLALAGCQTDSTVTPTEFVPVRVPASLYDCPAPPPMPEIATLTDLQTARYIVTLYKNNVRCRNSVRAIEDYVTKASVTVAKKR